jgi:hypothetical protein
MLCGTPSDRSRERCLTGRSGSGWVISAELARAISAGRRRDRRPGPQGPPRRAARPPAGDLVHRRPPRHHQLGQIRGGHRQPAARPYRREPDPHPRCPGPVPDHRGPEPAPRPQDQGPARLPGTAGPASPRSPHPPRSPSAALQPDPAPSRSAQPPPRRQRNRPPPERHPGHRPDFTQRHHQRPTPGPAPSTVNMLF